MLMLFYWRLNTGVSVDLLLVSKFSALASMASWIACCCLMVPAKYLAFLMAFLVMCATSICRAWGALMISSSSDGWVCLRVCRLSRL